MDRKGIKVLVLATSISDAMIILWCLRESGYKSFVLGNLSINNNLMYSPLCNKFYALDEKYTLRKRSKEILSFIKAVVTKERIDIVIPSGFESVKFLSQYQDEIKKLVKVMPVPSLEVISTFENKHSFSLFCYNNDIPHPRSFLLENIEILKNQALPLSFPLLTKPLALSASRGIFKFDNKEDLCRYLINEENDKKKSLPLLLQEFIPGEDIDFNAFAIEGELKAWTVQRFIEIPRKNKEPFRWKQFIEDKKILKLGRKIIKKTKYTGPINIGIRKDSRNGEIKAFDPNPRVWASMVQSICDGVNFVEVGIKLTFNSDYMSAPKCSDNVWGSPHKIPYLIILHRNLTMIRYSLKHTFFQIKYRVFNILFLLSLYGRKLLRRKKIGKIENNIN